MNVIEELRWRGMVQDLIPETEAFLTQHKTAVYLGVDPTSDSMHIGNLATVMMLVHFQQHGHTPVALVGGATGRVGDPSGKDHERQLMTEQQIEQNSAGIQKQLAHFLDFEGVENPAKMVNNYDWFKELDTLTFLREVGKHITISYMLNKESVKKRLQSETGISYTEFAYQLIQGYDFLHLFEHEDVRVQVGGSDQWGNITTGTELIRRKTGGKAYAVVCPLITREDGSKFGKTADGKSVWLDPEKTSPYEFYQYWMQISDADAEQFIKRFTLKSQSEIEGLIATHHEAPHQRQLQQAIAEDITTRVHGPQGLEQAQLITSFLFGRNTTTEALKGLKETDWHTVARIADQKEIDKQKLESGMGILDFLVEIGLTKSKGEARRAIEKDKSIRINLQRCETADALVNTSQLYFDRYMHVQKGKKQKFIVQAQ